MPQTYYVIRVAESGKRQISGPYDWEQAKAEAAKHRKRGTAHHVMIRRSKQ